MTRSPTVIVPVLASAPAHRFAHERLSDSPLTTPCAAKSIIIVRALEKMKFCPEFSAAREVAILTEAFSYVFRVESYCATSYFSLLKAFTRRLRDAKVDAFT